MNIGNAPLYIQYTKIVWDRDLDLDMLNMSWVTNNVKTIQFFDNAGPVSRLKRIEPFELLQWMW